MPFPFYNTAAPTSTSKNTINSVTVDYGIRDFLLNCNLGPVYPQIATNINGSPHIGEPVLDTSINGNTNVTPQGLPLETWGLFRYNIAVLPNQFQNNDQNAPELISVDDITQTQGVFGSVDFPQGSEYPTSPTTEVGQYGILGKSEYAQFRKNATRFNLYLDASKQTDMSDYISLQPIQYNEQISGYLDEFGQLNQGGGPQVQSANVIGSLLNGQGVGLAKGGIIPNFDVRASLAGRTLGATGVINDSRLGQIGGQQLAFALANNAAFNVEQDILGSLNVQDNILALVKGGPLPGLRPDYKITVPTGGGAKAFDYAASILGFTLPKSYLNDNASIFSSENKNGNIQRANAMIENTGKGQFQSLIANVNANLIGTSTYDNPTNTPFRSGYVPGYAKGDSDASINPTLYAFYDDVTKGTILNFLLPSKDDPNGLIPQISFNRPNMIKKYGFIAPEDTYSGPRGNTGYDERKVSNVGFTWTSNVGGTVNTGKWIDRDDNLHTENDELPIGDVEGLHPKKSLLAKTQKLFNSKGMLNIVTAKGDMDKKSSQIETANGHGFSKGSAVLRGNRYVNGKFDGQYKDAENTYCRSWTTLDRYDKVNKLIRHRGLDIKYPFRNQVNNSVLDDNGFVKIAPYIDDVYDNGNVKRYMFSIENLAWYDAVESLMPCEQGPGDLLTGKKGRIMWFPPYDIQFNETSSVSWEKNDFIGRGESIYTYNNTERSGSLSFKMIIDHSNYMNAFSDPNGPDDNYVASFVAGCLEEDQYYINKLTKLEQQEIKNNEELKPERRVAPKELEPTSFNVYFPNDVYKISTVIDTGYENGLKNSGSTVGTEPIDYSQTPNGAGFGIVECQGQETPRRNTAGNDIKGEPFSTYLDRYNYGLNGVKQPLNANNQTFDGWINDLGYFDALKTHLTDVCKHCVIKVHSSASVQGTATHNQNLANNRAKQVIDYLKSKLGNTIVDSRYKIVSQPLGSRAGCTANGDVDTKECKEDRHTFVKFEFDQTLADIDENNKPQPKKFKRTTIKQEVRNRFYNECSYFEKVKTTDPFIYDSFSQKIRYFHPSFHSTTPEGFNSRLTFLQQCTRQGPTKESLGAINLAFGRAPVCILRIGDFYNTKIIIDNLNIDYEPLVWDLNPEGVGVQPMIANVNISFKFIGGSTLRGAINKLQNALSFNYYANSQVFDPRADYLDYKDNSWSLKVGDLNMNNPLDTKILSTQTETITQDDLAEASANAEAKKQPASPPSSTPIKEIDRFSIQDGCVILTSDGTLSLDINTESYVTTKNYDLTIMLKSSTNSNVYTYVEAEFLVSGTDRWLTEKYGSEFTPTFDGLNLDASYNVASIRIIESGNPSNIRVINSNISRQ